MSERILRKSIRKLFEIAQENNLYAIHFKFTGGEATLNENLLIKATRYIHKLSKENKIDNLITLITNAVSISSELLDFIKENNIAISLSLDGLQQDHDRNRILPSGEGSFSYVEKNLNRFLNVNINPLILCTVSPENLDNLPNFVEYLLKKELLFNLSFERSARLLERENDVIDVFKEIFQVIENNLPKYNLLSGILDKVSFAFPHETACLINKNFIVIDQNGKIPTCQMNMGNVCSSIDSPDPFSDLRKSDNAFLNPPVDQKTNCAKCQWRYWCGGGCPLLTKRLKGTAATSSPYCNIYKALIPDMIRLEGVRMLKYS
jgi:uncharacterized protein